MKSKCGTSGILAGVLVGMLSAVPVEAGNLPGRSYVGVSPMLAIERFKSDWTEVDTEDSAYNIDLDNSWGLNLKGGYEVNEYLAVEALFQYFHTFEQPEREYFDDAGWGLGGMDVEAEVSAKGYTFTLNAKVMLPIEKIRPYAVAGIGFARYKLEAKVKAATPYGMLEAESTSDTESGPYARVGAGCDYFFTDKIALQVEAAYHAGMKDISAARIVTLSAGILYAF